MVLTHKHGKGLLEDRCLGARVKYLTPDPEQVKIMGFKAFPG